MAQGPARAWPAHALYDSYDLTPWLNAGENLVAVRVQHYGEGTFQYLPGPPDLLAQVEAHAALERGRMLAVAPAAAGPPPGQGGGPRERGGVAQHHRREPLQEGEGHRLGADDRAHGDQHVLQAAGRRRAEALADPCGLMATPATAAAWASASTVAYGLASQPHTSACTKAAPVRPSARPPVRPSARLDRRCTKPLRRAAASAVVVSTAWSVWANGATVVIGELLSPVEVVYILSMPKGLSSFLLTLMHMEPAQWEG